MPSRSRSRSDYTRTIIVDKDTGERIVRYDRSTSSHSFNGGFVYSIFILICALFVFIGAFAVEKHKDNPMGLIIDVSHCVSDYGSSFKLQLDMFNSGMNNLKFAGDLDEPRKIVFWFPSNQGPRPVEVGLPGGVFKVFNGLIEVVRVLLIIPYALTMFSVGFLVMLVRIIGVCVL